MRLEYTNLPDGIIVEKRKAPSLVDLCVQTAIDNRRYIGDVGQTDSHLLQRILPHCDVEQLMHIENATTERDLSSVTDELWMKFYKKEFADNFEQVVERIKKFKVKFNWRQLYQAKLKEVSTLMNKKVEEMSNKYKVEIARRQSRQVQFCSKVPPVSRRRTFSGAFGESSTFSNVKSNILKKAKAEHFKSAEMKNRVAIQKGATQQPRRNVAEINRADLWKGAVKQPRSNIFSNSAEINRAAIRREAVQQARSNIPEINRAATQKGAVQKPRSNGISNSAEKNRETIRKGAVQQLRSNSVSKPEITRGKGINSYSKVIK